jgi:recombination protein RecT
MSALAKDTRTFKDLLVKRQGAMKQIAANGIDPQRVIQVLLASIQKTPSLANCTQESIFRCAMHSVELGFYPGSVDQKAYLVPFKDQCTLIVGYKGMVELAYRSRLIKSIRARAVYEGDKFSYKDGLSPVLDWEPGDTPRDPKKITHAYCIVETKDGGVIYDVMTKAEIDAIRGRSKASGSGPWVTDYAEMAKKTIMRRTLKMAPMSIEMVKADAIDMATETGDGSLLAEWNEVDDSLEVSVSTRTEGLGNKIPGPLEAFGLTESELFDFENKAVVNNLDLAVVAATVATGDKDALWNALDGQEPLL